MRQIIIGIGFLIAGSTGQFVLRGTNSPIALVLVGIVLIGIGIFKYMNPDEDVPVEAKPEEAIKVIDEKMVVYNKTHESLGVLSELEINSNVIVNLDRDYGRFYLVRLPDGQVGYILKTAKFALIKSK